MSKSGGAAAASMRFEDDRFGWLAELVAQSMKWVDRDSIAELLAVDSRMQLIRTFFESASATDAGAGAASFLCIYGITGDTFETDGQAVMDDDDDDDGPRAAKRQPRYQKLRHQKLHVTNQTVVPKPVAAASGGSAAGGGGAASAAKQVQSIHCLCLVKIVAEAITAADAQNWQREPHCKVFSNIEVTCLDVPSLQSFQTLLAGVFLPLVEDGQAAPAAAAAAGQATATTPAPTGTGPSADGAPAAATAAESSATAAEAAEEASDGDRSRGGLKAEVVLQTHRLQAHIAGFITQVSAERSLPMPANPIPIGDTEADIKAAASNDDIVRDIDATVNIWHKEISEALAQDPKKEGPLGEIEYWKEKFAALSGLYDQITRPEAQVILRVAQEADCNAWHSMSGTIILLHRQHADAKDNVKFLSTLDRHFRAIHGVTADGPLGLQPILDTMQSMMMAIRMVWIISRCYNTEEKMVGLLEKIAELIAIKVKQYIDHRSILSKNFAEAKRKIEEGQQVLIRWRTAYENVAKEINESEREQHWMFDKKRLFDATDYMADRCKELLDIVETLAYYHNSVLGPRLKAVLTDTTTLDAIEKKVEALKKPIEGNIDLFDKKSCHTWNMTHSTFKSNVSHLNQDVARFIQKIFDEELRSAESAFDLMLEFKSLQSHGDFDINRMLQSKADKILQQFHSEIVRVEGIFTSLNKAPPLTKNQPPIAGSIHWSTSLIMRLRKPYIRFRDSAPTGNDGSHSGGLFRGATGEMVQRRCLEVVSMMRNYNTERFERWKDEVRSSTSAFLKRNILTVVKENDADVYAVNFNTNLFEIIKEAKYLDRLGFEIPPEALNVTLQDEAYHSYVDNLKSMLANFNRELALVGGPEKEILKSAVTKLKQVLKPGLEDLNWISLGIADFIKKCNGEITEFRNLSR